MTRKIQFMDDIRSLHRPAWETSSMSPQESRKVNEVEGNYVYLKTRNAVYDRALATHETRDTITVVFVKKSNSNKSQVIKQKDVVRKSDVLVCRVYKD
jgi:hypothetical protein